MKQRLIHQPFALWRLAIVCSVFAVSVHAQQAVVQIQGELTSVSCTATVNGGSPVQLPSIKKADIPKVGDTAGTTTFTVNVYGCNVNSGATVKAYFYANHTSNGRLNITSGAGSGWQYQLLPASGNSQLDVKSSSTPSNNSVDSGKTISSASANINYRVRYYRSSNSATEGYGYTSVNVALFYL